MSSIDKGLVIEQSVELYPDPFGLYRGASMEIESVTSVTKSGIRACAKPQRKKATRVRGLLTL